MTLSKYLFHRIKVPFSTLHLTEMTFSRWFFVTLNVVFAFLRSSTLSRMQQKVEGVLSRKIPYTTIACDLSAWRIRLLKKHHHREEEENGMIR